MSEPIIYIGYKERWIDGEIQICIALSKNPEEFTGEYHKISAAYGTGSYGYWLFKLNEGLKGGNEGGKYEDKQ
jgi:hypothetical protein